MIYIASLDKIIAGPFKDVPEAETELKELKELGELDLYENISFLKIVNTYNKYMSNEEGYVTRLGLPKKD